MAPSDCAASIAAYSVGTPKKIVGWWVMSWRNTAAGVGRSAMSIAVAPTANPKAMMRTTYKTSASASASSTSGTRKAAAPTATSGRRHTK